MTEHVGLVAEKREETGKGPARRLRMAGKVPAIIYGNKGKEENITLGLKELYKEYHKGKFKSKIIDIKIGNQIVKTLPRDIQLHPVTDMPEHADFLRVSDDSIVNVWVNIELINTDKSPGLKRGGVLNLVRHQVEVYARADSIPDHLTVDLAGLQIGETIHNSRIAYPEGVSAVISDRDFTIATIVGRSMKTEEEEAADAAAAEAAAAEAAEAEAAGEAAEGGAS